MSNSGRAMNLEDLPVTARAEVPVEWLDEMGHMNVMWYTHLFSKGVWGFFQLFDFSAEYMQAERKGSFALELHVRYLAECRVKEQVTVRTRALGRSAKRIHYMHFLVKESGQVLSATGEIVSAHVDMAVRRQSPFPDRLLAKYDEILTAHQALPWEAPVCGTMRS